MAEEVGAASGAGVVPGATGRLAHPLYLQDLDLVRTADLGWDDLDGCVVAVSGATGLVGTFLVDVLMRRRELDGTDVRVLALGRSAERARGRLPYFGREGFSFEEVDVSVPGSAPSVPADVVFHLASTTHPRAYATQPVGTVASNVVGLMNLLEYACQRDGAPARFVFASSVEVYGENRGDVDRFDEAYCGYIDCNTLRAGYPESKRCGEALCQAYAAERGMRVYVPRLPRTFGPTVLSSDTKAVSQFVGKGVAREDVVLKSEGTQTYSYLYVADTVAGMLHVLAHGQAGVAYNLADARCDVSLADLAHAIAHSAGTHVVFELPDEVERAGYSTATRAMLDPARVQATGWRAHYGIDEGMDRTLRILRDLA
ncbi:MAG: NAD-dependent epimerase/dehydratase family protein [Atopobiaceae bacterium]|nr:NAD-dependent epimerase/dehydratase family protein [Atopobiaceae bacterium]